MKESGGRKVLGSGAYHPFNPLEARVKWSLLHSSEKYCAGHYPFAPSESFTCHERPLLMAFDEYELGLFRSWENNFAVEMLSRFCRRCRLRCWRASFLIVFRLRAASCQSLAPLHASFSYSTLSLFSILSPPLSLSPFFSTALFQALLKKSNISWKYRWWNFHERIASKQRKKSLTFYY